MNKHVTMTLYSKNHKKYISYILSFCANYIKQAKLHTSVLKIMSHAICLPSLISHSSRIIDLLAGQFCAFLF